MSPTMLAKCTRRTLLKVALVFALAALVTPSRAAVATVPLGRAEPFAVLAGVEVNNTGTSLITGNVGVSPGTVALGFPPGTISGLLYTGNVASADAQTDLAIAYDDAAARTPNAVLLAPDIGGLTLTGGVYQASGSITSGDLILNGRGDAAATFIFQVGSLTVGAGRRVILTNNARAGRVFWQLTGSATLGAGSIVKGNILADDQITIESGANLEGRALSRTDDVIIDTANVRIPSGGAGSPPPGRIVIDSVSPLVLNQQTGLLEQSVRLRNDGANAVAAAQLVIRHPPFDTTVQNAVGKTINGHPYILYNVPLASDSSADVVIEFYRPSRQPFNTRTFLTNAVGRTIFAAPVGQRKSILRKYRVAPDRMLLEFAAVPGARYMVEYSDDRIIWKAAQPAITAGANRVWWTDYGAPKTEGAPVTTRAYRVVQLF